MLLAALALVILQYGVGRLNERYKKQLWDPDTAALVNGRPVRRQAVDELLALGFYPPLSFQEGAGSGAVELNQLLGLLIEEELVLQAAEKEGLAATEAQAAEYLEKSNYQITDIAFMTGYENASKFAAVFKAAKGENPLEYRRKYRSDS